MTAEPGAILKNGVLRPELFMGIVISVSASGARMTLSDAAAPSASHFETGRYGRGEVGEFVLIEGQLTLVLARLIEASLPERERKTFSHDNPEKQRYDIIGFLQLLGTVRCDTLRVTPGVTHYPRIGDRVYAAPHAFVGQIPMLQDQESFKAPITLNLGDVRGAGDAVVAVRPEKLLGRHCAVLGATGGGKSWTVARLLEEVTRHQAKVLLLDATSEYRTLSVSSTQHYHLGFPVYLADGSISCSLPAYNFQESDFIALFEPAGKVQGPKLREAIRSLRLIHLESGLASDGILKKHSKKKEPIERAFRKRSKEIEAPDTPFDVLSLAKQLMAECVFPDGGDKNRPDPTVFGGINPSDQSFCLPLASRIHAIVSSVAFRPVFGSDGLPFAEYFSMFLSDSNVRVMRLCLGGVSYEYRAREFIVNAIGRVLLNEARNGSFRSRPLLAILDEAHNFLGHSIGYEDAKIHLDSFELVAREGRKYGLNLCLATQRPRDLTDGVLSQIGTLIVHRLTNDRDREIVERACGEIDRSASAFLASLRSGEAAIIGVDFPIPLTVQIHRPSNPPASDGPDYQSAWRPTE
jgi:hypothetical protein